MQSYTAKRAKAFSQSDLLKALTWEDPRRTTVRVRSRVNALLESEKVNCCWSGKKLVAEYAIDHAMPFSRWPNNDLWNLLPTKTHINARKSDKLPSSARLQQNRRVITEWWQQGWSDSADEFFIQANLALPNLPDSNRSFEDVFDALTLQRDRIKDFQQLEEW